MFESIKIALLFMAGLALFFWVAEATCKCVVKNIVEPFLKKDESEQNDEGTVSTK